MRRQSGAAGRGGNAFPTGVDDQRSPAGPGQSAGGVHPSGAGALCKGGAKARRGRGIDPASTRYQTGCPWGRPQAGRCLSSFPFKVFAEKAASRSMKFSRACPLPSFLQHTYKGPTSDDLSSIGYAFGAIGSHYTNKSLGFVFNVASDVRAPEAHVKSPKSA